MCIMRDKKLQLAWQTADASNVDTLRKKSANDPVRFGLFDTVAALFADARVSFVSGAFFGLVICIGINI